MSPAPRFGARNRRPAAAKATPAITRPRTQAEMEEDAAKAMPEDVLQARVVALCRRYGVRHYHPHDSRRSTAGWPDSAMVGPAGFMLRELKREGQNPTPQQREWLADLGRHVDVDVWRPTDYISGRIEREIAALAGREEDAARVRIAMDITRATIRRATRPQGDPK